MFNDEVFEEDDLNALVDDCEAFWNDLQFDGIVSAPTSMTNDFDLSDLTVVQFDVAAFDEEEDDSGLVSEIMQHDRTKKNRKRRINEVERLQKFSWEKVVREDSEAEKRVRYDYINRSSGARVSSLRLALQQCRAPAAKFM